MTDQQITKLLLMLTRRILRLQDGLSEASAGVQAVKIGLAGLTGVPAQEALATFAIAEKAILDASRGC
jgi:hypothetical protein